MIRASFPVVVQMKLVCILTSNIDEWSDAGHHFLFKSIVLNQGMALAMRADLRHHLLGHIHLRTSEISKSLPNTNKIDIRLLCMDRWQQCKPTVQEALLSAQQG